ncbi:transaldolase/EF-hand domain-containing protein [Stieleria neptunia]|uniref:Transaldolase/EF-hand domain-containing protein n=1 Tax=Stieleria neptunia TaxID=2527979 RepID=A0A518I3U0_9BACT|nr:EF-hand domain-containing protein [Stieleria neptunia]QDV47781.1 transaldolase/EF-hand domain-containing protein [Stieleria neptunia]
MKHSRSGQRADRPVERMATALLTIVLLFTVQLPILAVAQTATDAEPSSGMHDMLLLLPNGPLHLRVQITNEGKSLEQTRQDYLDRLVTTLDMDKDGKVSREETSNHPLFTTSRRFQGNAFLNTLRNPRPFTERELALAVDRAAGQLVTYRQNNALAEQDLSVFSVLDQDQSGLIDRREMRLAAAGIAERDSDFDQCITFDEFLSEPAEMMNGVIVNAIDQEPPGSVHAELLRNAAEPIMPARLVRRYDRDRDAHLTADELGWNGPRIAALDADGNQQLSMQELAKLTSAQPDLTLSVDLSDTGGQAMKVLDQLDDDSITAREDLVQIKHDSVSLGVSYRHRDPMAEAISNASDAFNAIDVDANGYLDRDEIIEHQRFERYLFDAMDKDGDDRVFADEMMAYVKEYTEPASTSCQVTLLDTGNGFFQLLDVNADGRISIRELRRCEQTLMTVAGDQPQINPSQMTASYRIEIKRGGVSLFGRVDRPSAETPAALLAPPSGPIWFQRMDRNGDGDLTWDEFLGPRDVFHQLDQDQDHLIDKAEASNADKLAG